MRRVDPVDKRLVQERQSTDLVALPLMLVTEMPSPCSAMGMHLVFHLFLEVMPGLGGIFDQKFLTFSGSPPSRLSTKALLW